MKILEKREDWRIFPPAKYDFRVYKYSGKLNGHNNPIELQYSPFHIYRQEPQQFSIQEERRLK